MPAIPLVATVETDSAAPLVLEFGAIGDDALAVVGGKAANLGVLTRAGLPVPPGVCVTTDAYRQVAAGASVSDILDAIASTPATDTARLAMLAGNARAALMAAPVPGSVADAVVAGYEQLGHDVPVAVRSSATAEDLPFASFAGQQDTYLNIVGADAVLDAVRRCWASLWTDRAVAYRATQRHRSRAVRLAVVDAADGRRRRRRRAVHRQPGHRRRRQAVIDASPGLGEAVVSGAVNPDHFVVDTDSGEIVERRIGDKRIVIRAMADGGTEHVERQASNGACLTDEQIRALAALGDARRGALRRAAGHRVGDRRGRHAVADPGPADHDAVPAAGRTRAADPEDLRVYFCFSVAQGLYRPITPMGLAAFRLLASSASRAAWLPGRAIRSAGRRVTPRPASGCSST